MERTLAELLESYSAALQQPQLGEESEQCSKKWRELKEAIEAAFSRKNDVIESLQRQLEMARSESGSTHDLAGGGSAWDLAGGGSARDLAGGGSAQDFAGGGSARDLTGGGATQDLAEGLQDEIKEATQSLVQQPSDTPEVSLAASQSGTGTRQDLERNGDQNVEEMESLNSHSVETGPITSKQESESQANATTINENTQMATNDIGTESSHAEAGMELSRAEAGISGSVHDPADDGEYQRVDHALLYYHKTTGYYYDPATQQFYAPASYPQGSSQPQQQLDESTQAASDERLGSGQTSSLTGQTSDIASMLAAASDQVTARCGYAYDESTGMYYDSQYGLYYDQDSQLYYDAESGTYYSYDPETRQYQVHSRVKLPPKKADSESDSERVSDSDVIDLCSSEEDSPEEGEIRPPKRPKLPRGPPPPEEEWAPALRMVVTSSDVLPKGTLFVVTQEGASIGREPGGANGVKIPELLVSKNHAQIRYSQRRKCFIIKDLGSRNGTLLNQERLSDRQETSSSFILSHHHTLTLGTTSLSVHIHSGWEVCEGCLGDTNQKASDVGGVASGQDQPLDLQRRREMNRIKKKFGLRVKDTYGEKEAGPAEGYTDRATTRRDTVGSDAPPSHRPDDPPSSVHRPISEGNKGRRMLEKMGWSKGRGLGRQGSGIAEPVMAEVRDEKSGLGTAFSKRGLEAADKHSSSQKHQRMLRHFAQVVSREQEHRKL